MGEFSITHILLVLAIVLIFFGPSRLPSLGSSLGKAIRGFKDAMKTGENEVNDLRNDVRDTRDVHPASREAQANQERLQAPPQGSFYKENVKPETTQS